MLHAAEVWPHSYIRGTILIQIVYLFHRNRAGVAQVLPPIPLDAYRLCTFVQHRTLEIVCTSISLLFGGWE